MLVWQTCPLQGLTTGIYGIAIIYINGITQESTYYVIKRDHRYGRSPP